MAASIPAERLADELRRTRGMIVIAARNLGVSRATIYNRIHASPRLAEILNEEREMVADVAETRLFDAIDAGDLGAVRFYLSTKAKDRGYVERQEVTGKDGADLVIREVVVHEPDAGGSPT